MRRINTWTADGLAAREAAMAAARRRERAGGLAARAAAARVLPAGMERPDPGHLTALAAALMPTEGRGSRAAQPMEGLPR